MWIRTFPFQDLFPSFPVYQFPHLSCSLTLSPPHHSLHTYFLHSCCVKKGWLLCLVYRLLFVRMFLSSALFSVNWELVRFPLSAYVSLVVFFVAAAFFLLLFFFGFVPAGFSHPFFFNWLHFSAHEWMMLHCDMPSPTEYLIAVCLVMCVFRVAGWRMDTCVENRKLWLCSVVPSIGTPYWRTWCKSLSLPLRPRPTSHVVVFFRILLCLQLFVVIHFTMWSIHVLYLFNIKLIIIRLHISSVYHTHTCWTDVEVNEDLCSSSDTAVEESILFTARCLERKFDKMFPLLRVSFSPSKSFSHPQTRAHTPMHLLPSSNFLSAVCFFFRHSFRFWFDEYAWRHVYIFSIPIYHHRLHSHFPSLLFHRLWDWSGKWTEMTGRLGVGWMYICVW